MIIKKILHKILEVPFIFQIQQKVCNNYDAVFREFSEYLNTSNKSIIEIGCSTANCASEIVDMNYDGILNIQDIIQIINLILNYESSDIDERFKNIGF